ncbi:AT-rich interactive domain-containing protein 4A isoform X2 [Scleropages formosus]|uniref:AT-rich interactive domain-containing protein 4A isoform X2 n=1 Tax=Scleropages formosus TaxID=113540 RepID=UPI00087876D5|nr:AT-rich interactive domain-containing protein 4A isoform X2 [Scleropages formosus]
MKAADEPAYLTVGTDVSAKYRGAFCEAKIKTVKRMVKVKVVLKGDSTSQVVQDDQVKGPLRVGSTVEVKSPEGGLSEAVISKLTDASWYTVVFDDGDERTLRRTSLCLKGERHFAESETLDQLPLTNPEHFGTPVIGKKTNRGRRSSLPVAEDERESSSSEEEEEDRRRLNDDLLGKVACVQTGMDQTSWYLALVISPSCNDDLTVKKDQCLVRSFADSKFYTVARKEVCELDVDSISKLEFSCKKGCDEALLFLNTKTIPESWKMDMSEILESSSSDDEDGEDKDGEEEEKEADEEEPESEPDPEERDHFLQQLYKFMEDRGTPINKPPVLGYKDLNLFKLFRLVYHQGGCDNIESGAVWKQIYMDLGIPVLNSAASYNVKTAYRKYLYGFEEYCRSANIQFRTIHHNDPRPPPRKEENAEVKDEAHNGSQQLDVELSKEVEAEHAVGEEKASVDKDESGSESEKEEHKEMRSPRGRRRCTITPLKSDAKESAKLEKIKEEKGQEHEERSEESHQGDEKSRQSEDAPSKRGKPERRSRRLEDSDKDSDDEEQEDYDEDSERARPAERGERETEEDGDEDSEHSLTGTKVKVKYGRGKTQKIYEANIKSTETDDGEVLYLVHYYGWNVRYDEWVKADRIIWPVDKGGTKRKQKKKNKEEAEKEERSEKEEEKEKQSKPVAKRGRPPLRSTPPNVPRSVSKTPSNDGRSSSKGSRQEALAVPNGEGTPRRRTRRSSGMYDSDRGSNEESGNSSSDSDSEGSPEKKLMRVENLDPALALKEEEEDQQAQKSLTGKLPPESETLARPEGHQVEPPILPGDVLNVMDSEQQAEEGVMAPDSQKPSESREEEKSPKPKGRRGRYKEQDLETSPTKRAVAAHHMEEVSTDLLSLRKLEEEHREPLEILLSHSQQERNDSDTDSATEEICSEDTKLPKSKSPEERTPERKVRIEMREEPESVSPERRLQLLPKGDDRLPVKEVDIKPEMPALTSEVSKAKAVLGADPMGEEPALSADEELMPQIGLEALLCHEVDLDDLDEKEKPPSEELLIMMRSEERACQFAPPPALHPHSNPPSVVAQQALSPSTTPSPSESQSTKSESDVTIEVDSVAGEGLCESESANGFDASTSSSSSSVVLQDRDGKDRGQKRSMDCSNSSSAKKQKRNQKHSSTALKGEKPGAGHSSDSEDLLATDTPSKLTPVKHSSMSKMQKLPRSPALGSSHSKDGDKDKHRDKHAFLSPRTYKWTFQLTELENMTSTERITFLQDKLQEIRKYYMSLKSEVASIDRRRKRLKKKEREVSHTAASTSSGSSDTGMSPSSASPAQNTVAVECR